jgi:hypothetical protein
MTHDPLEPDPRMARVWEALLQVRVLSHFLAFALRGQQRELAPNHGRYSDEFDVIDLYPHTHRDDAVAFAKAEAVADFPYTHGLALIRLCTILESAVNDVAREVVKGGKVDITDVKTRLKGAELAVQDDDEKALQLVEGIRQLFKNGPGIKKPLDAHDWLLNRVGMSGSTPQCVADALNEAVAVRNSLVHRDGKIDAVFRKQCAGYHDATVITVRPDDSHRYHIAAVWYIYDLIRRVHALDGLDDLDALRTIKAGIVERLQQRAAPAER